MGHRPDESDPAEQFTLLIKNMHLIVLLFERQDVFALSLNIKMINSYTVYI